MKITGSFIVIIFLTAGFELSFSSPVNDISRKGKLFECTKHDDCEQGQCCTFQSRQTLKGTTNIIWKCKPLGDVNRLCHSLGNVHCPCRQGLKCKPKSVWFFGAGVCEQK
nr:uncharacterized protein LOC107440759 [Parasteatoda tepidariorum]